MKTFRTHQLADHLHWAEVYLKRVEFSRAHTELRHAMKHANRLKRNDLKSLISRAMNHIRSAQSITKKAA